MQVTSQTNPSCNLFYGLFHLVPKNLISFFVGWLVRRQLPEPLLRPLKNAFVKAYKLKLDEAEFPLEHYKTLEDLFTRRLKPGLRPVAGRICSPADGFLARSAPVFAGTGIQAKGLTYSLSELVYGQGEVAPDFDPMWFQTIYLAPHNYHRVHSPVTGRLVEIRHFPGELWPVNQVFVPITPRLFARNERLVFTFELETGGRVHAAMVGALNVGRITTPFVANFATNAAARQVKPVIRRFAFAERPLVTRGDEIGTFMLGSTVVLVYERAALTGIKLVEAADNEPILMGQALAE